MCFNLKTKSIFVLLLVFFSVFSYLSFAKNILIIWNWYDQQWKIFWFDWTNINKGGAYIDNNTLKLGGFFRSESIGWCKFINAHLQRYNSIYKLVWNAWCNNWWWVNFSPRNSININDEKNSDVYLGSDGYLKWYARNSLLWYIKLNAIIDIIPPHITNQVIPANKAELLWNIIKDNFKLKKVQICSTNGSCGVYVGSWIEYKRYDFSKAGWYSITATDWVWNTTTWWILVVANVPDDNNSTYYASITEKKLANWQDYHTVHVKLVDKYWNNIKNVYLWSTKIKDVSINIKFSNNVCKNQISCLQEWDAIKFLWDFSVSNNQGQCKKWDCSLKIYSYSPTYAGYKYATWDISINELSYTIKWLNWYSDDQVWWAYWDKTNNVRWNFMFLPIIKVTSINNKDNWNFKIWYSSLFSWRVESSWNILPDSVNIKNLLSINDNILLSFQKPKFIKWWTVICSWYNAIVDKYLSEYIYDKQECNSANKSNIVVRENVSDLPVDMYFRWTPLVILAANMENNITYNSIISYRIDEHFIKYRSLNFNGKLINKWVKIIWLANSKYIKNTLWIQKFQVWWDISKPQVRYKIYKTVYKIKNSDKVKFIEWND